MPVDASARFFTNKQGFGQAGLSAGAALPPPRRTGTRHGPVAAPARSSEPRHLAAAAAGADCARTVVLTAPLTDRGFVAPRTAEPQTLEGRPRLHAGPTHRGE